MRAGNPELPQTQLQYQHYLKHWSFTGFKLSYLECTFTFWPCCVELEFLNWFIVSIKRAANEDFLISWSQCFWKARMPVWSVLMLRGSEVLQSDKWDIWGDYRAFPLGLEALKRLGWSNKLELLVLKLRGKETNQIYGLAKKNPVFLYF